MKKLAYSLLTLVMLFFGFTLTFQNQHAVDLNYYFGLHWNGPLAWMLFLTLTLGIIIGFLGSLRIIMRIQRQLVQARKELRRVEQEVTNLRALPIKDVI